MSQPSMVTVIPVTSHARTEAAAALRLLRDRAVPTATAILRSTDAPAIGKVDVSFSVEAFSDPYEPGALVSEDQIALAQPGVIGELLDTYETVVWLGSGLLPTGIPLDRTDDAVRVAARGNVVSLDSVTPSLSMVRRDHADMIDPRLIVVSRDAKPFLAEWAEVVKEAVVDVHQGPVNVYSQRFVIQATTTDHARAVSEGLLMSWSEFAALESNRAAGRKSSYLRADELFALERERALSDEPSEMEWQMVQHLVHDSRPIEFLREAISAVGFSRSDRKDRLKRFTADARRAADPFGRRWSGPGSDVAFSAWLRETNQFGITRASEMVIREHALWWQYPGARRDPTSFHAWLDDEGVDYLGFDPRTLTPAEEREDVSDDTSSNDRRNPLRWRWNILKGLVPGADKRAETKRMEHVIGPDPRRKRGIAPPKRVDVIREPSLWGVEPRPLTLLGGLSMESGLGQAARMSLDALQLLGRDFTHIDTSEAYPSRNLAETHLDWSTHGSRGDVNLIHINALEMVHWPSVHGHRFGGRFNVAMWFWETADLPPEARLAFDIVDELWVASEYLVDVFGQYGKVPVYNIGLAADLPQERQVNRASLGLSDDEFVFLFVYDAYSSYGRKNPTKAIQAFINAFAPKFDRVRFLLKVSNLNKFPASQAEILGLERRYPAITVIDQYLTRDGVLDLMAASDVYISLHAAEGFGLTLLEAMAMGTPTVCTAYSGNMDFTTTENSWLVDYDIVSTDEEMGPYPAGSIWANPNIESATEMLRRAAGNRDEVAHKAERARTDALAAASLDAYAKRLDAQLRRVGA